MARLFEGNREQTGMRCPVDPPAHDIAGVDLDDEGDLDERLINIVKIM